MIEDNKNRIIKIIDGSSNRLREAWFIKNQNELHTSIIEYCLEVSDLPFKQKIWHWVNEYPKYYLCTCGNTITFNKNWIDGYRKGCSPKCVQSNPETKAKRKATTIEKYGVDNVSKSDLVKKKQEETNIERYGSKSSFQNLDVQERWKNNIHEKYGVSHISKLVEVIERIKETNLERYGVDHYSKTDEYIQKCRETSLEKFGVDHYSKTDEFKNRIKITNIEKYGVDHYTKNDEYKNRVKIINNEKYNTDWYYQSDNFKKKSKETNIMRRGVDHHTKDNSFKESVRLSNIKKYGVDSIYKDEKFRINNYTISKDKNYIKYLDSNISLFSCNKGHNFEINQLNYHGRIKNNTPLCTICNPIGESSSIKEKILLEYIKYIYNGEVVSSYRDGLEIDIYIPQLKLGFEFNGLYWHSDKYKEKNYHLDKTNFFKNRGIRIIHIWEDDWDNRLEIINSQINNLLNNNTEKVFARKCYVGLVDTKTSRKFLDENHLQGFVSSNIKIGLYQTVSGVDNDELISIMTFDSFEGRKKMEEGGYNLSRFCNKIGTNVIGGASKLLKHFIKKYNPIRVVSYADKDWSIGNLYYKLGFKNVKESRPDYKYIINNNRVHKSRYKKSKLKTDLTESKQMELNNIPKVYDCGKIKFELISIIL